MNSRPHHILFAISMSVGSLTFGAYHLGLVPQGVFFAVTAGCGIAFCIAGHFAGKPKKYAQQTIERDKSVPSSLLIAIRKLEPDLIRLGFKKIGIQKFRGAHNQFSICAFLSRDSLAYAFIENHVDDLRILNFVSVTQDRQLIETTDVSRSTMLLDDFSNFQRGMKQRGVEQLLRDHLTKTTTVCEQFERTLRNLGPDDVAQIVEMDLENAVS